jgi:hypothetical protein
MNGLGGGPASDAAPGASGRAIAKEAGMVSGDQPGDGWTLVLRRQPARIVEGQPEGGYTDAFEIICCDCGDHPDQDYREVSPRLQLVRGPYPIADGVAAYDQHRKLHQQLGVPAQPAAMADAG